MGRWSVALPICLALIATDRLDAFAPSHFTGSAFRSKCSFVRSSVENDGFLPAKADVKKEVDQDLTIENVDVNLEEDKDLDKDVEKDLDKVVDINVDTNADLVTDVVEDVDVAVTIDAVEGDADEDTDVDTNIAVDAEEEEEEDVNDEEEDDVTMDAEEDVDVDTAVTMDAEEEEDTEEEDTDEDAESNVTVGVEEEDGEVEARPPLPPSDESVIQAYENDVEEESSTLLEEQISIFMGQSAATTVGSTSNKFYVNSLQRIRDCKSSTERSLARSTYEKEKAAERIAKIKEQAAKQIEDIETILASKLNDAQLAFDVQKVEILKTLNADIEKETVREGGMSNLIRGLDAIMESKQNDIAEYSAITEEIKQVRSKIAAGTVASQLDVVLEQKKMLVDLEYQLVNELTNCKTEAESIGKEARRRKRKIEKLVNTLELPDVDTVGDVDYDFAQIKEIELLMQEAVKSATQSNKNLRQIKSRFDKKLLERIVCAGEVIPDSLKKEEKEVKIVKVVSDGRRRKESVPGKSSSNFNEMSDKNEQEIASILAKSIGKLAVDGAKAGIFGVKALFETLKDDEVSAATNEAISKSSEIGKRLSPSEGSGNESSESSDSLIKDSLKSTSDTLGAVGKAGSAAFKNVKSAPSASQATDALQETSNDFMSVFNAARALGVKSAKKLNEQMSTPPEEKKKD